MYDASKKSIEQNIEETRLVVRMAHAVGVSVEAELGRVGGAEGGGKARAQSEFYTNPDEAERFVNETGVDSLAVAVGNAHGFYAETPKLDFDLIATLRKRTGIPLVLHGGSGIADDDFRRAIALGIRKINFFTEINKLGADRVRELIRASDEYLLHDLMHEAKNRIREVVMERIRVWGSEGACALPGAPCPSAGKCRVVNDPDKMAPAPSTTPAPSQVSASKSGKPDDTDIAALVAKVVAEVLSAKRTA